MNAQGPEQIDQPTAGAASALVLLGAVPHAKYGLDDSDSWDGDAARKRMRAWASSDGSGDWDKVNHGEYAKGFGFVAEKGDHEADYKLPHHDVKDGHLVTVWGGVRAAGNGLSGARGGAEIPSGALASVKAHLAAHYHEFGKEAPWEAKNSTQAADVVTENVLALLRDEPNAAIGEAIPMPRIGGEPPKEFRAFKWGDNPTTKGLLRLTPEGAQLIMDTFRGRGVVLCFDYFHATYNPAAPAESRKAAGHTAPELRPDGLWYTRIQWTPSADRAIRDGEWPFISPGVLHNKAGVIVALKNPGLVTDPGMIGAIPTVLSGLSAGTPPKGMSMDKKRMVLDCYAALETAMKRCQALADTDGMEKDMGSMATGMMASMIDKFRGHMGTSGMMDDAAMMSRMEAGKDRVMAALSAELGGESDPDKMIGKLFAKLTGAPQPIADEGTVKKLLLDGYSQKVPTARRAALEAGSIATLVTFLSNAGDIVPTTTRSEATPMPPTDRAPAATLRDAPQPATLSSKPKALSECSHQQRVQVEAHLETSRRFQGSAFNEAVELDFALSTLSADDDHPVGSEIRHLPYGMQDGQPTVLTRTARE